MKKILYFIAGLFCGVYRKTMLFYAFDMILLIFSVLLGANEED